MVEKDHLVYYNDPDYCPERWEWWWKSSEDEDGSRPSGYWCTNDYGEGVFYVNTRRNERSQLVGTCDFSLCGLSDPKAKIRRWMKE